MLVRLWLSMGVAVHTWYTVLIVVILEKQHEQLET